MSNAITYKKFVEMNLPVYTKAGMSRSQAKRQVDKDWVIFTGKAKNPVDTVPSLFRDFHGALPTRARNLQVAKPSSPLIKIGRITKIEYQPEGSSRHKNITFFHNFGDTGSQDRGSNSILATDKDGKNLFIIKEQDGKYPYFSGRGIIG